MTRVRMLGAGAVMLAWLSFGGVLLRHVSIGSPADARAQCEADGGNWAASFPGRPGSEASCISPSEKASCFRPWTLTGPEKDLVCGDAVPPR